MAKSRDTKESQFIKKPVYEGGTKALKEFVSKNLKYPKAAWDSKTEGTVVVHYTIDYKGNVIDAKTITNIGNGCEEEAIRIVKLLKFKVAKKYGVKIKFNKNIKIHFRLPKKATKPLPTTPKPNNAENAGMQYNYVTTPKPKIAPKETPKPKKSTSYTITINIK